MSSNPQWGVHSPSLDTSIMDYKALSNIGDEHANYHAYNNLYQQPMQKEQSIYSKPLTPSSGGPGYGNNSFNSFNGGSAFNFSIGTFSANERPPQQQLPNSNSNSFGQSQQQLPNSNSNSFGSNPSSNSFSSNSNSNSFGSNSSNSFGSNSNTNPFGSNPPSNAYGSNSTGNSFGSNSASNTFGSNSTSNSFGSNQASNAFGSNSSGNSFGSNSASNAFPSNSTVNPFGSNSNSFQDVFSSSSVPIPGVTSHSSSYGGPPPQPDSATNQGIRETGIIEKLLHSYGFIQCCERQARLFFHFSQFNGNIEHLKIGDPVEFEMTYDRRTGKPIASAVSKIAPEVVGVVLSEERVTGTVTTELRTEGQTEQLGRISYENRGECFFLPYNKDDVEGNVTLRSGDKVSFQIAAKQRGNLGACHIRLENPVHPVKYQGVVCTMKESFGFIERADVVKEIFFHFSEAKIPEGDEMRLGDDVEFNIQTRNGKEVACSITRMEPGSVVFEDVCTEIVKGQVLKPLERGQHARQQEDALPGRIRYRAADHSEVEIPFGEKDQRGDFTLRHGDWVQFRVATDRRDQLRRATNISLLTESFAVSGERREQGVVSATKDGFGFIKCAERDLRVFFHFNEVLDMDTDIQVNNEVEFTIVQQDSLSTTATTYSNNRQSAIRIMILPSGTVSFETLVEANLTGTISKEAQHWGARSPTKQNPQSPTNGEKSPEPGQITYQQGDAKKVIAYYHKDIDIESSLPRLGDKVEFNIVQMKRTKKYVATAIMHLSSGSRPQKVNGVGAEYQGFIAALKDGFGFIETIHHDREIFFHFSNFEGDVDKLELGLEVEYNLGTRGANGSCMSAENVRVLPRGTIPAADSNGPIIEGTVVRPLRCFNPEQAEYAGLVKAAEGGEEHEFGITGLVNKRELLQPSDPVQFQVDSDGRATNIVVVRKKRRATVDAVKGQFGFLTYEVEEGKKLFFHMTEVKDGQTLQTGDTVEFYLVTNHRNGKSSACNVTKITDNGPRPERLIARLRTVSLDDGGPRLLVIRQPRGPDGSKGFADEVRQPRSPGMPVLITIAE